MATTDIVPQESAGGMGRKRVVNDMTIQVATVNGSGSQSSNTVLLRAIFQMGVPVSGKNMFPSNIAGLPTWFTIRANKNGYIGKIAQTMQANGMPPQFFYLGLVESNFDARACGPPTRFGIAKGMWQFIPTTARNYGLRTGPFRNCSNSMPMTSAMISRNQPGRPLNTSGTYTIPRHRLPDSW